MNGDVCARESKLSAMIEKSRSIVLLHRFFTEGKLATQASVQPCNDNEYIGAALTFAQHLNHYVLGKACEVSDGTAPPVSCEKEGEPERFHCISLSRVMLVRLICAWTW
jgi:hypothetical protein